MMNADASNTIAMVNGMLTECPSKNGTGPGSYAADHSA
jgi:hypothetical protein